MRGLWALFAICIGALAVGSAALAQDGGPSTSAPRIQSPILLIDADEFFRTSAFGKRVIAEISSDTQALGQENRRIEAELSEEEKALTEQRPTLTPSEFRDLADAFDTKVRQIRTEQEGKARAIAARRDTARAQFLTAAAPVLEIVMRDAGAAVILERRAAFLSLNAIDITQVAVARVDAEIGEGQQLLQNPRDP